MTRNVEPLTICRFLLFISPSAKSLKHVRGALEKASIKNFAKRSSIYSMVFADRDNLGPWLFTVPFILNRDIHALADNLKDCSATRFFSGMDHAFASVNARREPARCFPQRFQTKRVICFVAPGVEDLRVV